MRVEFLDLIEPGLDKPVFLARLETDIETATARLIAEGERELAQRAATRPHAPAALDQSAASGGPAMTGNHDGAATVSCTPFNRSASRCSSVSR